MYCVIMGDIVGSKKYDIDKRDSIRNRFKEILNIINYNYRDYILSDFRITLGDEIQGLLAKSSVSLTIILRIYSYMYEFDSEINIRFGIGISKCCLPVLSNNTLENDGKVYHLARKAIKNFNELNLYNTEGILILFNTDTDEDLVLNDLGLALNLISSQWTDLQAEKVWKMFKFNEKQNLVAEFFDKTAPTISNQLSLSNYKMFKKITVDIMKYIDKKYDNNIKTSDYVLINDYYNEVLKYYNYYDYILAKDNIITCENLYKIVNKKSIMEYAKALILKLKINFNSSDFIEALNIFSYLKKYIVDYKLSSILAVFDIYFYGILTIYILSYGKISFLDDINKNFAELNNFIEYSDEKNDLIDLLLIYLNNILFIKFKPVAEVKNYIGYFENKLEKYKDENITIFANIYLGLSYNCILINDYNKAIDYQNKAICILSKIDDIKPLDLARIDALSGYIFQRLGRYKDAIKYYECSLENYNVIFDGNNYYSADILNNLGDIYNILLDYKKSKYYYKNSFRIFRKILGKYHLKIVILCQNIGKYYFNIKKFSIALYIYNVALNILKKIGETYDNNRIDILIDIARLYSEKGDLSKAKEILIELTREEKINESQFSYIRFYLGYIDYKEENYSSALNNYQLCMETREKIYFPDVLNIDIYSNMGDCYIKVKKYNKAYNFYKKAILICKENFDDNHPILLKLFEKFDDTMERCNDNGS